MIPKWYILAPLGVTENRMDSRLPETRPTSRRRQLASFLRRIPWAARLMRVGFRYTRARYTAGVVGVVLNSEGKILLVEHVFHPFWAWGLPGGWLGRAEDPAEGLRRELREETSLDIVVLRPLLIQTGYSFDTHLDISFLCRIREGTVSLSPELLDYRWLRPDAMPRVLPFHSASIELAMQQPEYEVLRL